VQLNEEKNWKVSSRVIENWVDVHRINEIGSKRVQQLHGENLVVSVIGNCSKIKDHKFVLEIFHEFNNVSVFHIGQQSQITNEEMYHLSLLWRRDQLLCNGPMDSALEKLAHSDLHVLSSLHEGMGLVIAESVTLGIETWIRDVLGVQWARGLPGLKFYSTQSELRKMLSEKLATDFTKPIPFSKLMVESERFSPARGVREYSELYKNLIRTKREL
jgi:glycosyltransferase involved in cell wall biosynthesis